MSARSRIKDKSCPGRSAYVDLNNKLLSALKSGCCVRTLSAVYVAPTEVNLYMAMCSMVIFTIKQFFKFINTMNSLLHFYLSEIKSHDPRPVVSLSHLASLSKSCNGGICPGGAAAAHFQMDICTRSVNPLSQQNRARTFGQRVTCASHSWEI